MKRLAVLGLLALALAPRAWAQDGADKARLDEFTLPAANASPGIDQLESPEQGIAPTQAPTDRQVAVPGPPATAREPVVQLSRPDDHATPRQLSDTAQSRSLASNSVSTPRDSRPQPVAALAGQDRCDPQADPERFARCKLILELRAAEFAAAEAPRLSAEQALLAQQGEATEVLAESSSKLRLQLASGEDPDADVTSNQELAAIYLAENRPDDANSSVPEQVDSDGASPGEALESLQIGLPGTGSP